MRKESGNWAPSHWKPGKVTRYLRHVYKRAVSDCVVIVGGVEGCMVGAKLQNDWKEHISVVRLRLAGVKLIGDK